jgi:single-strand DNA-binding protein
MEHAQFARGLAIVAALFAGVGMLVMLAALGTMAAALLLGAGRLVRRHIGSPRRPTRKEVRMLTWREVEARIERAREALASGQYRVREVAPTDAARPAGAVATFAVRNGRSEQGQPYTVAFYENRPSGTCTCPDFAGRGGPACKHTALVVLATWPERFARWVELVRAQCAPEEPAPPPDEPGQDPQPAEETAATTPPAQEVERAVQAAVHEALAGMKGRSIERPSQRPSRQRSSASRWASWRAHNHPTRRRHTMYHKIIIVGNLGRDPELRYTADGTPVTTFSVATNRRWSGQDGQPHDETTWFRVSAWRRLAETCAEYLQKGRQVLVEGQLKPDPASGGPRVWTGNDGVARAQYEVTALGVKFLGARGEGTPSGEPEPATSEQPEMPEEEIPF